MQTTDILTAIECSRWSELDDAFTQDPALLEREGVRDALDRVTRGNAWGNGAPNIYGDEGPHAEPILLEVSAREGARSFEVTHALRVGSYQRELWTRDVAADFHAWADQAARAILDAHGVEDERVRQSLELKREFVAGRLPAAQHDALLGELFDDLEARYPDQEDPASLAAWAAACNFEASPTEAAQRVAQLAVDLVQGAGAPSDETPSQIWTRHARSLREFLWSRAG